MKSAASSAHEGDTVTYSFKVTNTGDVALTNVATKEQAEKAAHVFAEDDGHGRVEIERKPIQPGVGGEDRGVKTFFVGLVGLLVAAMVLIVIAAPVSAALNI